MAYVKIIYQDSPSTATPMNAANLNHMDDGIAENDRRLNELETAGVVNTFNGRSGTVVPDSNDYDINQIGATDGHDGYVPVWRNNGTPESPNWSFNMEEQGGSGHKILDADGNEMAQEDSLQFADSFVSDDDVNGKTVVENIKEHTTASDYENATEDGIHVIDDGEDAVIHPSSEDKVEVEGDGSKTYQTLLKELYDEIDSDKVTNNAKLFVGNNLFSISRNIDGDYRFGECETSGNGSVFHGKAISLNATLSRNHMIVAAISSDTTTYTSYDNTQSTDGEKITLYYGNKKAVVDLQTTANRCLYDDNTTVKQKIDNLDEYIYPAGTYRCFGVVCKKYYNKYQLILPFPNANMKTISISKIEIGYANSDVEITSISITEYSNSIRVEFSSETDYSGYMGYANVVIS